MQKDKAKRKYDRNYHVENEFICDNIFKACQKQPYLDSTQKGKWGRGKDDSPVNEDEYLEELNKHRATSRLKTNVANTVSNTEGSY